MSNPDDLLRKATVIQNWRTRAPGASFYTTTNGLKEYAWFLAFGIKTAQKNIIALHAQKLGRWERIAERLLRSQIVRPEEHGFRAEGTVPGWGRQTGKFTFGRGGALRGVLPSPEDSGNRMIMGFPDIPRADTMTRGAWRALELGMTGIRVHPPPYSGVLSGGPLGSVGMNDAAGEPRSGIAPPLHSVPMVYYFSEGKLRPLSSGSRGGEGFPGKHFIEQSSEMMAREIVDGYQRVFRTAWK